MQISASIQTYSTQMFSANGEKSTSCDGYGKIYDLTQHFMFQLKQLKVFVCPKCVLLNVFN